MKNKNVILAAIVLVSAIGTSIASAMFTPQPTWIKATKLVSGVATPTCSTLGLLCDVTSASNTQNCEVRVNLAGGAIVSTIGYGVEDVANNICSVPLRTAQSTTFREQSATVFTAVETYVQAPNP